jgi:hypothetical protein
MSNIEMGSRDRNLIANGLQSRTMTTGETPNKRWTTNRLTKLQTEAWNRQSIQIFADFSDFESPRGDISRRAAERQDAAFDEKHEATLVAAEAEPGKSSSSSLFGLDKPLPEPPYHVFTLAKKKQLVYIVSAAAIFSPLSSNIYFPALGQVSSVCLRHMYSIAVLANCDKDLNVSLSLLSLTITIYMVVQGIAPSFWGPFSDTLGRRPIFVGTFVTYLIANVGLALSKDFATLMVFRGIQAAGSAATISIGKYRMLA